MSNRRLQIKTIWRFHLVCTTRTSDKIYSAHVWWINSRVFWPNVNNISIISVSFLIDGIRRDSYKSFTRAFRNQSGKLSRLIATRLYFGEGRFKSNKRIFKIFVLQNFLKESDSSVINKKIMKTIIDKVSIGKTKHTIKL